MPSTSSGAPRSSASSIAPSRSLITGGSAALELVGEPGIGKSRLVAELIARADTRGHLVLSGSASELERDLPFGVFVDAIDEYLQALEPRRLDALDDETPQRTRDPSSRRSLASLAPSEALSSTSATAATAPSAELLERLTATKPLVLVLDDVHWADPASVELLGSLLRRPPDAAVLIVLALRPRQAPERLSAALEPARRSRHARARRARCPDTHRSRTSSWVRPSTKQRRPPCTTTAAATPSTWSSLPGRWSATSAPAAATPDESLADLHVPPVVAAALAEELALLPTNARLVLQGAAVAGDPFDPELAAAAAAVDGASALDGVDELLRLDLIRETDVPRRFRFRHPLVRRAVYESAPAGWRLGAHERSAEALAARGVGRGRARSPRRAGRAGRVTKPPLLRCARPEMQPPIVRRRAQPTGSRARSDCSPTTPPPEERVELLLARAGALATCGHFAEAHAALLESIELVPKEAVALRVRLTTACAGGRAPARPPRRTHTIAWRARSRASRTPIHPRPPPS